MSFKNAIDKILEKIISRKLLVFMIATILLGFKLIDSGDWAKVAMFYITAQGAKDIINGRI